MEVILQNLTYSKLEKADLKKIKDKNIIKLFKLGQLSVEYLLYTQKYLDSYNQGFEREYNSNYQSAVAQEEQVKENQKRINELKERYKNRKQTIKTYEKLLNKPDFGKDGAKTEVFRCLICFKYFANNEFLNTHYKKRHRDYYDEEIKQKENKQLLNNLKAQTLQNQFDEDHFMLKLKEEVVDKFETDIFKLQSEITTLKKTTKLDDMAELLVTHNKEANHQAEEVQETVKTYEIMIEEFKNQVISQIQNQKQSLIKDVEKQIEGFIALEEKKDEEIEDKINKEETVKRQIQEQIEKEMIELFDLKFKSFQREIEEKDRQIDEIKKQQDQDRGSRLKSPENNPAQVQQPQINIEETQQAIRETVLKDLEKERQAHLEEIRKIREEENLKLQELLKKEREVRELEDGLRNEKEAKKEAKKAKKLQEKKKNQEQELAIVQQQASNKEEVKRKSSKKREKRDSSSSDQSSNSSDDDNNPGTQAIEIEQLMVISKAQSPKKQQQPVAGGKQSRAGVFEDDEDDSPVIVKEIEYIPSPVKEKKDKKEKKKDSGKKLKEAQEGSPIRQPKFNEDLVAQQNSAHKSPAKEGDSQSDHKKQVNKSPSKEKVKKDKTGKKDKGEKKKKSERSNSARQKKLEEIKEEVEEEEKDGTSESLAAVHQQIPTPPLGASIDKAIVTQLYELAQKPQGDFKFLNHKYSGNLLTTYFKYTNGQYEKGKVKLAQKMKDTLRSIGILKGIDTLNITECQKLSNFCLKKINPERKGQIDTLVNLLVQGRKSQEEIAKAQSLFNISQNASSIKENSSLKQTPTHPSQDSSFKGTDQELEELNQQLIKESAVNIKNEWDQEEESLVVKSKAKPQGLEEEKADKLQKQIQMIPKPQIKPQQPASSVVEEKKIAVSEWDESSKVSKDVKKDIVKTEEEKAKEDEERIMKELEELEQQEKEKEKQAEEKAKLLKQQEESKKIEEDKQKEIDLKKKLEELRIKQQIEAEEKIKKEKEDLINKQQEEERARKQVEEEIKNSQKITKVTQDRLCTIPISGVKHSVVLVGDSGIGKSSLAFQLANKLSDQVQIDQSGKVTYYKIDSEIQLIDLPKSEIELNLDIIRQSQCVIIAFNSENEPSFSSIKTNWNPLLQKHASKNTWKLGTVLLSIAFNDKESPFEFNIARFKMFQEYKNRYVNYQMADAESSQKKLLEMIFQTAQTVKTQDDQDQVKDPTIQAKKVETVIKEESSQSKAPVAEPSKQWSKLNDEEKKKILDKDEKTIQVKDKVKIEEAKKAPVEDDYDEDFE